MKKILKWIVKWLIAPLFLIIVMTILITHLLTKPSNDRDWTADQTILPYAEINGDLVSVHNIRNFSYASTTSYTAAYYDKTFDLDKIKAVYYIVEPFSGLAGSAHTFLSFEFEEDEFVAISIEIRKEKGEKFSPLKGLFNQYEITYVIADERDVVKLRSNFRKDLVYVYPIRTTKEEMSAVFIDMVTRASTLREKPEFYNTLTNTCTTNIMRHANNITPKRIPLSYKVLLPAYSDRLAYDLGLIDTDLSFEEAREKFLINDRAEEFANEPDFSKKIRQ